MAIDMTHDSIYTIDWYTHIHHIDTDTNMTIYIIDSATNMTLSTQARSPSSPYCFSSTSSKCTYGNDGLLAATREPKVLIVGAVGGNGHVIGIGIAAALEEMLQIHDGVVLGGVIRVVRGGPRRVRDGGKLCTVSKETDLNRHKTNSTRLKQTRPDQNRQDGVRHRGGRRRRWRSTAQ